MRIKKEFLTKQTCLEQNPPPHPSRKALRSQKVFKRIGKFGLNVKQYECLYTDCVEENVVSQF